MPNLAARLAILVRRHKVERELAAECHTFAAATTRKTLANTRALASPTNLVPAPHQLELSVCKGLRRVVAACGACVPGGGGGDGLLLCAAALEEEFEGFVAAHCGDGGVGGADCRHDVLDHALHLCVRDVMMMAVVEAMMVVVVVVVVMMMMMMMMMMMVVMMMMQLLLIIICTCLNDTPSMPNLRAFFLIQKIGVDAGGYITSSRAPERNL